LLNSQRSQKGLRLHKKNDATHLRLRSAARIKAFGFFFLFYFHRTLRQWKTACVALLHFYSSILYFFLGPYRIGKLLVLKQFLSRVLQQWKTAGAKTVFFYLGLYSSGKLLVLKQLFF
jgi:hypothetical protein